MFSEYGTTIDCDMREFTEDIFGRTGGHLGLVSLLGKMLQEWINSLKPKNRKSISIEAWVGHLSNTRLLAGQIDASHSIQSILPCLSGKDERIVTSRQTLFYLMNGPEFMKDPSSLSKLDNDAVDFLETSVSWFVRQEKATFVSQHRYSELFFSSISWRELRRNLSHLV